MINKKQAPPSQNATDLPTDVSLVIFLLARVSVITCQRSILERLKPKDLFQLIHEDNSQSQPHKTQKVCPL
jgi:hypothetical protein